VLDFVRKISDERVRIRMTSRAEGMTRFILKFVRMKFRNANLRKERTNYVCLKTAFMRRRVNQGNGTTHSRD
jgi:hypothetical protein